eukprot:TRINITY_DN1631_c0_g1_i1.p1 TRINITY_DN1631_c0_g1~~TRINITY_DN1631_c0_g1_i1.p1  ORF type:complete len:249 (-),score=58.35 TRINITY_DN1631_c0_g1_i1:38-784(-)
MDEPFYGEKSPQSKAVTYVGGALVLVWVVFCAIIAVVFAIKESKFQHFILAGLIVLLFGFFVVTFRWYLKESYSSEYKWSTILVLIAIVVCGAGINSYVWAGEKTCSEPVTPTCPPFPCPANSVATIKGVCYPICPPGFCLNFTGSNCVQCKSGNHSNFTEALRDTFDTTKFAFEEYNLANDLIQEAHQFGENSEATQKLKQVMKRNEEAKSQLIEELLAVVSKFTEAEKKRLSELARNGDNLKIPVS